MVRTLTVPAMTSESQGDKSHPSLFGLQGHVDQVGNIQQKYIPHGSEGWKCKIHVLADLVSGEDTFATSLTTIFSLCPTWWEG